MVMYSAPFKCNVVNIRFQKVMETFSEKLYCHSVQRFDLGGKVRWEIIKFIGDLNQFIESWVEKLYELKLISVSSGFQGNFEITVLIKSCKNIVYSNSVIWHH